MDSFDSQYFMNHDLVLKNCIFIIIIEAVNVGRKILSPNCEKLVFKLCTVNVRLVS